MLLGRAHAAQRARRRRFPNVTGTALSLHEGERLWLAPSQPARDREGRRGVPPVVHLCRWWLSIPIPLRLVENSIGCPWGTLAASKNLTKSCEDLVNGGQPRTAGNPRPCGRKLTLAGGRPNLLNHPHFGCLSRRHVHGERVQAVHASVC